MRDHLSEAELDRSEHRSLVIALAGFSFAGLLGLVALSGSLGDLERPIWYMLLSFLSYMAVLNLQGYKALRWQDQLGDALYDLAFVGLIAAILTFVVGSELPLAFQVIASLLGVATWGVDYWVRVRFSERFLMEKEKADVVK